MRLCKNCKFFDIDHVASMPIKFVNGNNSGIVRHESITGFDMCMHPNCFEEKDKGTRFDPVNGYVSTGHMERVCGQAQLNKDGNCMYYRKSKWKFWIKE